MKTNLRHETLINVLNWIESGNAITICKPQIKRKRNPAGYSLSKTKSVKKSIAPKLQKLILT